MKIYEHEKNLGLAEIIEASNCEANADCEVVDAVPEKYSHINFKPTESMASAAKTGLEMRAKYNRGGTSVGVARARQLINRQVLSPSTVKRMFSFFSRHEVDKKGKGFKPGTEGYPSAGRIAWNLWGGDSGFSWSRKIVDQMEAADKSSNAEDVVSATNYYNVDGEIPDHLKDFVPVDSMLVNSILVSSNWNRNDDVFSPTELWAAKRSPTFKSANLNHIGREAKGNQIIGVILASKPVDSEYNTIEDNEEMPEYFHLITSILLWEKYWPTIVGEIREKIDEDQMYVSMECIFNDFGYALRSSDSGEISYLPRNEQTAWLSQYLRVFGGEGKVQVDDESYEIGRWLRNIIFSGVGFVDRPANPESIVFQDYVAHASENILDSQDAQKFYKEINENSVKNIEMPVLGNVKGSLYGT